jgi:hypothetical protein
MIVRKLSPTGDFTFGASQLNFLNNSPEAVAQVVRTSLLLWLGEWYLDITLGMPWIEGVLGKHNQSMADITIQDFILGVQGVTDITSFTSNDERNERLYTGSVEIDTVYGPTALQIANQSLY